MAIRGARTEVYEDDEPSLDVPEGWYPMPDGRQRFWNGERWTENFSMAPPTPQKHAKRMRKLTWLAWVVGALILIVLAVAAVRILHLEEQQQQLYDQIRRDIQNVRP
ncbi:DUF2510 domain-containing protein [Oryzobacter telluris]|uniref:DUF2510 domain-containing protein n=1 Tax=Oryzobacter telluris TaxID=3149179 RepID=UPI00370DD516